MLGVPIYVIDKTIRSYVSGAVVGKYRDKKADDFNIVLRYDYEEQFTLEDFDKISVQSMSGRFIPLKQLADIEFAQAPSQITHLNTDRTATVLADLEFGYTLDPIIATIQEQLDQMEWKEGYSYVFK